MADKFLVRGTLESEYVVCVEAQDADEAIEIAGMLSSTQCLDEPGVYGNNHIYEAVKLGKEDNQKGLTDVNVVYGLAVSPKGTRYVITKEE